MRDLADACAVTGEHDEALARISSGERTAAQGVWLLCWRCSGHVAVDDRGAALLCAVQVKDGLMQQVTELCRRLAVANSEISKLRAGGGVGVAGAKDGTSGAGSGAGGGGGGGGGGNGTGSISGLVASLFAWR
jgi:hypothetical protein